MSGALLQVETLSVAYGPVRALTGVSLHVAAGEAVALVGANGAGKSTLFKSLIGLLRPLDGQILFQGRPIQLLAVERRARLGLGYAPEGRRVFPGLTVRENLEVASRRGAGGRGKLLDRVFTLFPALAERQAAIGWQLSGGQQQMLAIGRALMTEPELLLLDEPSLGLSPRLAGEVLRHVGEIAASGVAVLLAEQNVAQSLACCSRGYVLEVGQVALSGKSGELLRSDAVRNAYLGG